jgi:hypothetical protein
MSHMKKKQDEICSYFQSLQIFVVLRVFKNALFYLKEYTIVYQQKSQSNTTPNITLNILLWVATCFGLYEAIFRPSVN